MANRSPKRIFSLLLNTDGKNNNNKIDPERGFLYTAEHSWKNDPESVFCVFFTLKYTAGKPIPKADYKKIKIKIKILLNRSRGEKRKKEKQISKDDFTILNTDGKPVRKEDFFYTSEHRQQIDSGRGFYTAEHRRQMEWEWFSKLYCLALK